MKIKKLNELSLEEIEKITSEVNGTNNENCVINLPEKIQRILKNHKNTQRNVTINELCDLFSFSKSLLENILDDIENKNITIETATKMLTTEYPL